MNNIVNIGGVNCYEQDGTVYLKLDNVARGLGFTREKNGVIYVRYDRVKQYLEDFGFPASGENDIGSVFIPENIFYRLAMKAKNEVAESFQAKVADEIIPSIRKHGVYMTSDVLEKSLLDPDYLIQLANIIKYEREKVRVLEKENEVLKPKASYYDMVLQSPEAITVTVLAKDYDMSATKFNKLLNSLEVQYKVGDTWVLYAKHIGNGYTVSETHSYTHSDGRIDSKIYTKWTQAGRLFLYNLLKENGIVPVMEREKKKARVLYKKK